MILSSLRNTISRLTLDINEVLKTIPPEMVEDMKKQAEKYGFPFEEYVQSVLGAIVMDPDLGAY